MLRSALLGSHLSTVAASVLIQPFLPQDCFGFFFCDSMDLFFISPFVNSPWSSFKVSGTDRKKKLPLFHEKGFKSNVKELKYQCWTWNMEFSVYESTLEFCHSNTGEEPVLFSINALCYLSFEGASLFSWNISYFKATAQISHPKNFWAFGYTIV